MKPNKKAMILYYPLLVGIALAAGFFYYAVFLGHPAYGTDFIGEVSLKLIDFAQEAEKLLISVDQAAKILAQQSVYDSARNGGLAESECGQYLGLNVLNKIEKPDSEEKIKFCIEKEKIKDSLKKTYFKNLNSYFSQTDAFSSLKDKYEIEISGLDKKTAFKGSNKEGLVIPIGKGKEKAKVYGNYSINPAFYSIVDYDLNEFDKIIDDAKSIVNECHDKDEVEECVNDKRQKFTDNSLTWKETCHEGVEKVFLGFKEFITGCANSDQGDCTCSYTFPELPSGDYLFKLDPSQDQFVISIKDLKDNKKSFEENLNIKHSLEISEEFKAGEKLTLLKDPETKIISKFKEGHKDLCTIPKEFYTFCVESKYKVVAYDNFKKDAKLRNVEYNFALQIQDKPPAKVELVQVFDRPKDDTSFISKWNKNKEADVIKYRVYYAKSVDKAFENKNKIEDIKKEKNILIKYFYIEKAREISSAIFPDECKFDYEKKKCLWATSEGPVEFNYDDILYYKDGGFYYVSFNVSEDTEYDVLVTAIDRNDNEIEEISQDKIETKASKDDLPLDSVGFIKFPKDSPKDFNLKADRLKNTYEINNIDGSYSGDFKDYIAYYIKNPEENNIPDKSWLLNKLTEPLTPKEDESGLYLLIPIGLTEPKVGDKYYMVVLVVDKNDNPNTSQFKIEELGVKIITLTVYTTDSKEEEVKSEIEEFI